MDQLSRQLKSGILPPQLNYSIQNDNLDYSKIQYNNRYHSFDFYARKFPDGFSEDFLFEPIIQMIADKAKLNNVSPLIELNNMLINTIDNNVVSDSS